MDDTVQSSVISHCAEQGYAGRIDVVTGPRGRRRWPEHVKAEIVLESHRDGCSVQTGRLQLTKRLCHNWRWR